MTGFRFDVSGPREVVTDTVELDGIPQVGHRLRISWNGSPADLVIIGITWFHAPGALSKSGLITLGDKQP